MSEPTIVCPHCKEIIKLTESLAAPLIEATREQFKKQLAEKDKDIGERERAVRETEKSLAQAKKAIDEQVSNQVEEQLTKDRQRIVKEEAGKARLAAASDLDQKTNELSDLHEVLKEKDTKLAQAQQAQAEVLKRGRELDDAKRDGVNRRETHTGGASDDSRAGEEGNRGGTEAEYC